MKNTAKHPRPKPLSHSHHTALVALRRFERQRDEEQRLFKARLVVLNHRIQTIRDNFARQLGGKWINNRLENELGEDLLSQPTKYKHDLRNNLSPEFQQTFDAVASKSQTPTKKP
jgi:hypothetical protein